jgi:hypothetical protein
LSTDSNTSEPADQTGQISVDDALGAVEFAEPESRELEYEFEDFFSRRSVESEEAWIRLRGLKDHFGHKKLWSWFLMFVIGGMVIFQSVLIWKVGKGDLNFVSYAWLLPTVMIQYLAQIVGLAVFAVRSFFRPIS